jgi:hypothetical protein
MYPSGNYWHSEVIQKPSTRHGKLVEGYVSSIYTTSYRFPLVKLKLIYVLLENGEILGRWRDRDRIDADWLYLQRYRYAYKGKCFGYASATIAMRLDEGNQPCCRLGPAVFA